MKIRFHSNLIVLIIALSLFTSPCYLLTSKAFALSTEQERILGQKFLAQVRGHFELIEDDFANHFINDLGHYLITPLETKYFPFSFYIIKDNTPNAFAGPGGHIFIFSGLIEIMANIDELAAVLCHEIGHVDARHLAQRIEQSGKIGLATMAGVLAGVLIGGAVGGALATGSVAAGIQTQLHYSRKDERQSDQLGFKYMELSGFDPSGILSILEKIEKGQWQGTDGVPTYLQTHPSGPERLSSLDTLLSGYTRESSKREAERLRKLFPLFKTILRARYMDHQESEKLFKLKLRKSPSDALPHFGLGIIYKEKSDYALGIHHLNKALEGEPHSIIILRNLGEAYQMNGQNREAISVLEKALKLDQGHPTTQFLLGLSYENLGQYEEALSLFERLVSYGPVRTKVYYHLGLSYGRQDRLALAHYNFGLYFKRLGRLRKARFHFQKAHDLSEDKGPLKKKILRAMEREPLYSSNP
jgi:predicted Zn-dependent protease